MLINKFSFPPIGGLKKLVSLHLDSTRKSRWELEALVRWLKNEGRGAEVSVVERIIKKIKKHERDLTQRKEELLIERDEAVLKQLERVREELQASEENFKKLRKDLAVFFKEFRSEDLEGKLDRLASLYNKLDDLVAKIAKCDEEIKQYQDEIEKNNLQIEANTKECNKKIGEINQQKSDLLFAFMPEFGERLTNFLKESSISIPLPGWRIQELLVEHMRSHHDFESTDEEWSDDYVRFFASNILPLLSPEQKEDCEKKLQKFLQMQFLQHELQFLELNEKLTDLDQEIEDLENKLAQDNGKLSAGNIGLRELINKKIEERLATKEQIEKVNQEVSEFERTLEEVAEERNVNRFSPR